MPTVGHALASERVRQGLSLEQIAHTTKIGIRALRAIEADDFEQLPGIVFARSFVRQYAEALNLDANGMVDRFNTEHSVPAAAAYVPLDDARIYVPRLSGSIFDGLLESSVVSAFGTFVLAIIVCGAAFYGFDSWRTKRNTVSKKTVSAKAVPHAKAALPWKPIEAPATLPVAPKPPSPAENSRVNVELKANEACWTRIVADGKTLFADIIPAGEIKTVRAAAHVTIRAGNAGALSLTLNGLAVPAIGPAGQVRTVDFTPEGAQVRTPTPVVADF